MKNVNCEAESKMTASKAFSPRLKHRPRPRPTGSLPPPRPPRPPHQQHQHQQRQEELPSPPADPTAITKLILNTDSKTLTPQLLRVNNWTSDLVHTILKRLWDHGPKALDFFSILSRHVSYTHSVTAFDYAIDIAARIRDYKVLWNLVEKMKSQKLGPTPKTFAIIIERYVSSGKADKALKIFLSMHQHGCPQNLCSFNTFLDILCKSKRAEMAYKLLKMLRGRYRADTITYSIIVNGFCLLKRTPKAQEVLKEMVERGVEPNAIICNTMLKGFLRAGQMKEAWSFFLEMKKRKFEIDVVTYTTLVHGFGVMGEVEKARKLFNEMIGAGVLPSVATYNALVQVLCKKDDVKNALLLFDEMLRKGYTPNVTTYNVIIRGLCHADKMDKAMAYLDLMIDNKCEPNVQTYNVIFRYYCEGGDIEKSLDVFEKMGGRPCLPNLDTYNILINAMFGRKKSDDLIVAGKLLIEMIDRGYLPRRFTFNRVLNGLLLTGNQDFARDILRMQSRIGRLPRHFRL